MNEAGGRPISRAAVIRAMDQAYIDGLGLPSAVLMDQAGRGCAEVLDRRFPGAMFIVLCGPGNNGGDGYVVVRHLAAMRHVGAARTALAGAAGTGVIAVEVYPVRSPEAAVHHRVAAALGLVRPLSELGAELAGAGVGGRVGAQGPRLVIVDAIFGTGQRAPLVVPQLPGLSEALATAGVVLVAIDVPTGVDADTGECVDATQPPDSRAPTSLAAAFPVAALPVGPFPAAAFASPTLVVTIGRLKPFLFRAAVLYECVDIGLDLAVAASPPKVAAWPPEAVLVERHRVAGFGSAENKWSRGHVVVLAGSPEKAGAGVLVCLGALRAGAGLVTLCTPRAGWPRLGALPPEVMVEDLVVTDGRFDAAPMARGDALVVGPGLGRSVDGAVRAVWAEDPRPAVFDADALRIIVGLPASPHPRLLTPHAGEAAALLAMAAPDADRFETARRLRALAPTVFKGACTVVTGDVLKVLPGGLPQLGTAGSGDVLAGIAGALLARASAGRRGSRAGGAPGSGAASLTRDEVEALALDAAWLHQEAGRRAGGPGLLASEIADTLLVVRGDVVQFPGRGA